MKNDVVMIEPGSVLYVPVSSILADSSRTSAFWQFCTAQTSRDLAEAERRICLFDRASAEVRLIDLLLSLHQRQRVTGVGEGSRFVLPLKLTEIGEATGMTGIYVNRVLGSLVRKGLIEVKRPYIRILDMGGLEARMKATSG